MRPAAALLLAAACAACARGAAQGLVAALVAPLLPCAGLSADSLFVDVSLSSGPPPGAATRPNYRAEIGVTIANTGPRPLSLQHVRIAIAFSRRVRDPASGGWAPQPAPAADFLLACWTIEHVDASGEPAGASPCASVADATLTDDAIVLLFAKPLTLCAGCGLRGGGGDALLVVQHRSYLSLDLDAMQPLPVTCAGAPIAGLKPKLDAPDRDALAEADARAHPACAPYFAAADAGVAVACAPAAALQALSLTVATSFVQPQPDGAAAPNAFPPAALNASDPVLEILLKPRLANAGATTVALLGLRVPLAFARRALVPTSPPRWARAAPDEWIVDCWGGAVATDTGERWASDRRSACDYVSLQPTDSGIDLVFAGGALCAGCTLAGSGDGGVMFAVKHANGLLMDPDVGAMQPLAAPACAPGGPPPPPAFCGLGHGGGGAAAPPPAVARGACAAREDVQVSVGVVPFPQQSPAGDANATADDWASQNTELRLVPSVTNAGTRPLALSLLRLDFSFDFRIFGGPGVGFMRCPPSQFNFSCWYGAVSGPAADAGNACDFTNVTTDAPPDADVTFGADGDDGAPAKVVITFTDGWLCPGCTLSGGAGGVLGAWHHFEDIPLNPTGLMLIAASCDDINAAAGARDAAASYDVAPAAAAAAPFQGVALPAAAGAVAAAPPPPLLPGAVSFAPLLTATPGAVDPSAFGAATAMPNNNDLTGQSQATTVVNTMSLSPDLATPPPPATPPKICPWWRPSC